MAPRQIIVAGAMPSRDANGRAMAAKLYFYAPGTTTPAIVYASSALTTPLEFPVGSDSAGRFPQIWAEEETFFDVVWTNYDGAIQDGFQNIQPLSDAVLASVDLAQQAVEDAEAARDETVAIVAQFGDLQSAIDAAETAQYSAMGYASAASGSAGLAEDARDAAQEAQAAAEQAAADAQAIAGFDTTKLVNVSTVQMFTAPEKVQGRANIGAAAADAPDITGGIKLVGVTTSTPVTPTLLAINAAASEYQTKAISVASTFTITGATATKGQSFGLKLTLTAGAIPTFPAAVTWMTLDNAAPEWADGIWLLGFMTFDGGTNWYVSVMGAIIS